MRSSQLPFAKGFPPQYPYSATAYKVRLVFRVVQLPRLSSHISRHQAPKNEDLIFPSLPHPPHFPLLDAIRLGSAYDISPHSEVCEPKATRT
jgi:hypothetical protein